MIIEHAIGPTFQSELRAAGLGDGIMWSPNWVTVADDFEHLDALLAVIDAHDPTRTAPDVIVISAVELYRVMTDAEFDAMQAGVAQQSKRIQGIFERADTFRSDAPEWPLLVTMANKLYTPERAAELLSHRP